MTRRFWIALVLGLPVFLTTMADMVLAGGLGRYLDMRAANWIGLLFGTPVVLWAGWPFFVRGWRSLVSFWPTKRRRAMAPVSFSTVKALMKSLPATKGINTRC